MTSRHLPESEICNLAFKPSSHKERDLANWLKPRVITRSYNPYRATAADAVNTQLPLFPEGQVATPWAKLEALVRSRCRGDQELLDMNLPIAKSTHDFAVANKLTAEPLDVRPITLALGHPYGFGLPLILRYDGGASVAFTDLRRRGHLTPSGVRVMLAVLHQRFRVNCPELSALRLEIWRFADTDARDIKVSRHLGDELHSYEQLTKDFSETYRILNNLESANAADKRSGSQDGLGRLFGT